MQIRQEVRQRHARWQADVANKQLFREQLWWQRRQRLRWELQRRWHDRPRPELRRRWAGRPRLELHRHWQERPRIEVRRHWQERPRVELRRHWQERPRVELRRHRPERSQRDWFDGRIAARVVVVTTVLLLGGAAGYAAISSVRDAGSGRLTAAGPAKAPVERSSQQKWQAVPGLTRAGSFLSVAVAGSGGLQVAERARLREPLRELSLVPPPAHRRAGRLPRLEDVRVTADGKPVTVPSTIEVTTVVTLPEPATRIDLHYRVVGAVARDKQLPPGRAVVSLRPALGPMLKGSHAVVEVHGTRVLQLVCVEQPRRGQQCGVDLADGWRTRWIPAAASSVVAVVRLPEARSAVRERAQRPRSG